MEIPSNSRRTLEYYKKKFKTLFEKNYSKFLHLPIVPEETFYIKPFGTNVENEAKNEIDLIEEIKELIVENVNKNNLSIVISSAGGSGKTSLALELSKIIWDADEKKSVNLIPVYIHLPSLLLLSENEPNLKINKLANLNEILLKSIGLQNSPETLEILQNFNLIFLIDGLNEVNFHYENENLWELNKWENLNSLSVIYFTKPDHFKKLENLKKSLSHGVNGNIYIYRINSCTKDQIKWYIPLYIKYLIQLQHEKILVDTDYGLWSMTLKAITYSSASSSDWFNVDLYENWLQIKLPSLIKIAKTPFLLQLILQILPCVLREIDENKENEDDIRKCCATEVGIYDQVVKYWSEFQFEKIPYGSDLKKLEKDEFVRYLIAYNQNVATDLVEKKYQMMLNNRKRSEPKLGKDYKIQEILKDEETLDYDLIEPVNDEELFNMRRDKHFDIFPIIGPSEENEQSKTLKKNLTQIRSGSLLYAKFDANGILYYTFYHHTFIEYFAARDIFQGIRGELNYYIQNNVGISPELVKFNRMSIQEMGEIFVQLVMRAKVDEEFCKCLNEIIRQSKEVIVLCRMAANAATILCAAGKAMDSNCRDVQLPGAVLKQGVFANTDFTFANLDGCNFQHSYLPNCKFDGSSLSSVDFGEMPFFKPNLVAEVEKNTFNSEDFSKNNISSLISFKSKYSFSYIFFSRGKSVFRYNLDNDELKLIIEMENTENCGNEKMKFHWETTPVDDTISGRINKIHLIIVKDRLYVFQTKQFGTSKNKFLDFRNIFVYVFNVEIGEKEGCEFDPFKPENFAIRNIESEMDLLKTHFLKDTIDADLIKDIETKIIKTQIANHKNGNILIFSSSCTCDVICQVPQHKFYNSFNIFPWDLKLGSVNSISYHGYKYYDYMGMLTLQNVSSKGLAALNFFDTLKLINLINNECVGTLDKRDLKFFDKQINSDALKVVFSPDSLYCAISDQNDKFKLFILDEELKVILSSIDINKNSAELFPGKFHLTHPPSEMEFIKCENKILLLAGFRPFSEIRIIEIPSCSVIKVVNYNEDGIHSLSLLDPLFCSIEKRETYLAYHAFNANEENKSKINFVQLSNQTQNLKASFSKVLSFALSKDFKHVAILFDNENELKIFKTPIIYNESLKSQVKIEMSQLSISDPPQISFNSQNCVLIIINLFKEEFDENVQNYKIKDDYKILLLDLNCTILGEFIINGISQFLDQEGNILIIKNPYENKADLNTIKLSILSNFTKDGNYKEIETKINAKFAKHHPNLHALKKYNEFIGCLVSDPKAKSPKEFASFLYVQNITTHINCTIPVKTFEEVNTFSNNGVYETFLFYYEFFQSSEFTCICIATDNAIKFYKIFQDINKNEMKLKMFKEIIMGPPGCLFVFCQREMNGIIIAYKMGKVDFIPHNNQEKSVSIKLWTTINHYSSHFCEISQEINLILCDKEGTFISISIGNSNSDNEERNWKINWFSNPCPNLIANFCSIKNCHNLNDSSQKLLCTQFGAEGDPISSQNSYSKDPRRYIPLGKLLAGIRGETCANEMDPIVTKERAEELSEKINNEKWSVSSVVKKNANPLDRHMSLILEGVKNSRRFVIKIDLVVVDGKRFFKTSKVALILVRPFTNKRILENLVKKSSIQQFFITKEKGLKLLDEVRNDLLKDKLDYHTLIFNCKTYVINKLKGINIDLKLQWYGMYIHYPN